ncbi:conserved hypothetical protein [Ricinus communis]|uniref:Uncharacterized protein n=1 Tax=Ricinus communis TaxID=3988 RepID=B9RDR6_RICCO|nr:conserved hypothetical protein [Ricinus communis]
MHKLLTNSPASLLCAVADWTELTSPYYPEISRLPGTKLEENCSAFSMPEAVPRGRE